MTIFPVIAEVSFINSVCHHFSIWHNTFARLLSMEIIMAENVTSITQKSVCSYVLPSGIQSAK